MIYNHLETKIPDDEWSRPFTDNDADKELVEQKGKILDKLQYSFFNNNQFLLHVNCCAVTQSTMSDEGNHSWKYFTEMLKIFITDKVNTLNLRGLWSHHLLLSVKWLHIFLSCN